MIQLVQKKLKADRSAMLAGALNEITNVTGQINLSLNILDGAKIALDSFVNLGMSKTVEADDLLRSLLFGMERLPDFGHHRCRVRKGNWTKRGSPKERLGQYLRYDTHAKCGFIW